jgi:hypothetical protein
VELSKTLEGAQSETDQCSYTGYEGAHCWTYCFW